MHSDRAIEVLTLEVEQLSERKAALEAALLALMREKRRETDEQAKAFMAGEVGDAKSYLKKYVSPTSSTLGTALQKQAVHDFCAVCATPGCCNNRGSGWTSLQPCGYTALCMSQVYEHQAAYPNAVWRFA
jgi:hypothetical protein